MSCKSFSMTMMGDMEVKSAGYLKAMILCGFVLAALVVTTTSAMAMGTLRPLMSQNCTYNKGSLSCKGYIPTKVPSTVNRIVLTEVNPNEFHRGRFCNVSWSHVIEFVIASVDSATPYFDFTDGVFDCLSKIHSFEFSSTLLRNYSPNTFSGLSNVTHFSLVGCKTIHWKDLHRLLAVPRNLPKLAHLILSGSGIYDEELNLNQGLINSLSKRPIISLDFSHTCLLYNFSKADQLCQSLTTLSDAGAHSDKSERFMKNRVCHSLRVLDNSDSQYLRDRFQNVKCFDTSHGLFFTAPFFEAVRSVYIDKFATKEVKFRMRNCSFFLFNETLVREVHSSYNHFKDLDAELINDKLEILNFSHNSIKMINPNALKNLSSLTVLDLSHNKLSQPLVTFSELFKYNIKLKVVHLSSNRLSNISADTFESNVHLKELWMVKNRFQQIHFNITHLVNLSVLDLRHNEIKTLDKASQTILETLYDKQIERYDSVNDHNSNHVVKMLLQGNPFSCECEYLSFVQWFAESPIFSTSKDTYQCQIRGRSVQMGESAVNAAKQDCARIEREKLTLLLSVTLPPLCISLTVSVTIVFYKRHKKKLLNQRFQSGIKRLRENGTLFPVFLSYSSDDAQLVKRHMLQQFQDSLQSVTKIDRDLVCNADVHFTPGRKLLSEIFRCLKQCEVFVAVISKNYCSSKFCRYEIEHAHLLEKPIILIFIEHVPKDDMNLITRKVFETFTRVQFVVENDQYKLQPGWEQLSESVIQLL